MHSKVMVIANRLTGQGIGRRAAMVKAWVLVKLARVETNVAGRHRAPAGAQGNRQLALEHLTRYERVTVRLVREKDNAFDHNAVAVVAGVEGKGEYQVGYLPRPLAALVAPLMDAGKAVNALYEGVKGGYDFLYYGLRVEVRI